MSKTERISIKEFGQSAMINNLKDKVKNSISINDEHSLIERVVFNCFDGFEYNTRYKNIAISANILSFFCNVEYEKIDEISEFIYNENNLFDKVLSLINTNQLSNIYRSIDEGIEFKKQVILIQLSKDNSKIEIIENVNDCIVLFKDLLNNFSKSIGSEENISKLKEYVPKLINFNNSEEKISSIIENTVKEKKTKSKKDKKEKNNIIAFPSNGGDNIDKE